MFPSDTIFLLVLFLADIIMQFTQLHFHLIKSRKFTCKALGTAIKNAIRLGSATTTQFGFNFAKAS